MDNFDASTPQLKVIKKWIDAYASSNLSNLEPLICRDFKYQTFPKTTDLPEEAKGEHIKRMGELMANSKLEPVVHEAIEASGKVVIHATGVFSFIDGTTHTYETVCILTLVEEDGEIKILEAKDFTDAQKRSAFYAGVVKAAGGGVAAS